MKLNKMMRFVVRGNDKCISTIWLKATFNNMYFLLSIHLPLLLNLEHVITAHKQSGIFNGRNNLTQFFIRHIKDHFVYYIWVLPTFCQNTNQYRLSYSLAKSGLHSDIVHRIVFNNFNICMYYLLLHHARCRVIPLL